MKPIKVDGYIHLRELAGNGASFMICPGKDKKHYRMCIAYEVDYDWFEVFNFEDMSFHCHSIEEKSKRKYVILSEAIEKGHLYKVKE